MAKGTIQDLLDSRVEDYFQDDKCSECGNCCTRFLALSNHEINTIKAYIKRNNIQQQKHSINVLSGIFIDLTCPFLNDDKPNHKCSIYEVRPLLCKAFSCRKYIEGVKPDAELYSTPRRRVDMTELFFGNNGCNTESKD